MARGPRNPVVDLPYHLIVRGNNRQAIFIDDEDRAAFKSTLAAAASANALLVHAYVLMSNHVHLVATPQRLNSLAGVMQGIGRQYVRRFNRRHQRSGTLWEGRYRASIIQDDRYFLACQRYVESNPVRAGIVGRAEDYPWSSHRHHLGLSSDPLVSPHPCYWALGNTPFDREIAYRALFDTTPQRSDSELTRVLMAGHPLADADFLERLARSTGIDRAARPVGRPRKGASPPPPDDE